MIIVSFYPAHKDFTEEEHDAAILKYRTWLDQHGDYGRLYMMNIGKIPDDEGNLPFNSSMTGIKIYQDEIATLFRLMFEV